MVLVLHDNRVRRPYARGQPACAVAHALSVGFRLRGSVGWNEVHGAMSAPAGGGKTHNLWHQKKALWCDGEEYLLILAAGQEHKFLVWPVRGVTYFDDLEAMGVEILLDFSASTEPQGRGGMHNLAADRGRRREGHQR